MEQYTAVVSTTINAPITKVWHALIDPIAIKEYMFGTDTVSDWKVGSPIVWKGEWQGKPYEDKGTITKMESPTLIEYTHYSPLEGKPEEEATHTITIELSDHTGEVIVTLSQGNNANEDAKEHSEKNWQMMLNGLKKYVEEK